MNKRTTLEGEKHTIRIVGWEPRYQEAFIRLNKAWIEQYFCLEESDLKILGNPQSSIIDTGGEIFFALRDEEVVGCCALIHHPENSRYELAKMAVDPAAQGQGIGFELGKQLLKSGKDKQSCTLVVFSLGLHYLCIRINGC